MPETSSTPRDARELVDLLHRLRAKIGWPVQVMEVCGTHTVTAQTEALHDLLPEGLKLVSGPGCPVCVTPAGYIDQAARLATGEGARVVTYGDMIRVPGIETGLDEARRRGGDVSVVYSVTDALELARANRDQKIVFLAIGFETTAPPTAWAVKTARDEGLDNFIVYSAHKRIMPAMTALLEDPETAIDGYLAPGHVSVIIGSDAYREVADKYHRPCIVTGFDGIQMLLGLVEVLEQLASGEARVENVYAGRVSAEGNRAAQAVLEEVFEPEPSRWRGMGTIPDSGLKLREEYAQFDARRVFDLPPPEDTEPPGCQCTRVIKGLADPPECPMFATRCTPESPVGACMVSREGACRAWRRGLPRRGLPR